MKVKILSVILTMLLILPILTACMDESGTQEMNDKGEIRSIFLTASAAGYEGSYEEWLASIKGEKGTDGVGIKEIKLVSTVENVSTYVVVLTDGSISSFTISNGVDGKDGIDGKSAYELYCETYDYEGTQEEWLAALHEIIGHEHEYRTGDVLIPATCVKVGYRIDVCGCGDQILTQIPKAAHTVEKWANNATEHWQVCTECRQKTNVGAHCFNESGVCTVCGLNTAQSFGLEYGQNEDGTYTVTGIGSCSDTDIVIPSVYQGYAVTRIGDQAFSQKDVLIMTGEKSACDITSVTIPASVTAIGYYAFEFCENLTDVVFAENSGCTSIGDYAFLACVNLENIAIPDSVTSIGTGAFQYCNKLKKDSQTEFEKAVSLLKAKNGIYLSVSATYGEETVSFDRYENSEYIAESGNSYYQNGAVFYRKGVPYVYMVGKDGYAPIYGETELMQDYLGMVLPLIVENGTACNYNIGEKSCGALSYRGTVEDISMEILLVNENDRLTYIVLKAGTEEVIYTVHAVAAAIPESSLLNGFLEKEKNADHLYVRISSSSMSPTFSAGEYILFSTQFSNLQVGDIILFTNTEPFVFTAAHRIIEVRDDGWYQTKGDANAMPDAALCATENIIGVYVGA